jgi:hypothetical protein
MIQEYVYESANVLEIGAGNNKNTFNFQYSMNFIKHLVVIPITQTASTHYYIKGCDFWR